MINRGNDLKKLAKESNLYGEYAIEIKYLLELKELEKNKSEETTLNLAHAYFNNNQSKNALKYYTEIIDSQKNNIKSIALQQIGLINAYKYHDLKNSHQNLQAKNTLEKALSYLKKSIITDPSNFEARYNYELLKTYPDNFKDPIKQTPKKKSPSNKKQQPNQQQKTEGENNSTEAKPDETGTEKQMSPVAKPGNDNGNNKSTTPSEELAKDDKNTKNKPGESNPEGKEKGGLESKKDGKASENGNKGKISTEKEVEKEKPQLNKDKLKKMNMSIQTAEQLLIKMKMAEKQYIQQHKRKSKQKHNSSNESKW